ncbi:MAG: hypothetical protein A2V58_01865 [Candidatus Muproteobacteria bacterium RBG_19FT_COMBO_61_10]|uniref:Uncharacterized protein n=1 Tax=Candidatus Muproteobacteria bacterium RBG_19FT_COMBO_61_10 TaxID=1817761 RepID=A0A1F6UH64_9PROT|nr:MAG: hypothetical protein A2V58_01865 [Candidatus Muproteobacteria bacterium RBG_19FT_COMBO_61_10]
MKYLKEDAALLDMDSAEDTQESLVLREERLAAIDQQLIELPAGYTPVQRAALLLAGGRALIDLERFQEAWDRAREAFDIYTAAEDWEGAVQACEILFLSDQPESLPALGQGIWLAVTFPIDPELTVAMLQHVIDDTPPDSDGAAVAAIVAHYVVDMRAPEGKSRENLLFYTNQMLATVARRHSRVQSQKEFDMWFLKLELNDPALFLPRLRNVVDVLVQDEWWIDRDALHEKLPVN